MPEKTRKPVRRFNGQENREIMNWFDANRGLVFNECKDAPDVSERMRVTMPFVLEVVPSSILDHMRKNYALTPRLLRKDVLKWLHKQKKGKTPEELLEKFKKEHEAMLKAYAPYADFVLEVLKEAVPPEPKVEILTLEALTPEEELKRLRGSVSRLQGEHLKLRKEFEALSEQRKKDVEKTDDILKKIALGCGIYHEIYS